MELDLNALQALPAEEQQATVCTSTCYTSCLRTCCAAD
ncbi:ALQxL family class IV lanthipeptide [Kutzneria sp. 744]|nr:ALQxL family class IV lanthipeptide [Kutzneria sp. 744]